MLWGFLGNKPIFREKTRAGPYPTGRKKVQFEEHAYIFDNYGGPIISHYPRDFFESEDFEYIGWTVVNNTVYHKFNFITRPP